MKIITSKDNPTYKAALRLTKKKYRDETGFFLLEGVKPVRDALETGICVRTILVSEGAGVGARFPSGMTVCLEKKLFRELSDTETPQGVIAIAEKKQYDAAGFRAAAGTGNVVVVDRLQDPGNIGTIIRTAEAAGYSGVIMVKGSGDAYSSKAVRAAAGSLLRMPMTVAESSSQAIELTRSMGKTLVVTSLDAQRTCFEMELACDLALVIGNEGQGVGQAFLDAADIRVRIPMEGAIESLNAAVAAGILMYQLRKTKIDER